MLNSLPNIDSVRVLVLGDTIIDVYWRGLTKRISREAPIPIAEITGQEQRPGGAANVAANLAALGASVHFLSRVGDDAETYTLKAHMQASGVNCEWQHQANQKTRQSIRIMSRNQQLLRTDFLNPLPPLGTEDTLLECYKAALEHTDIVILSDYTGGNLSHPDLFIKWAKHYNKPIIIDPSGSEYDHYHGASIIKPNHRELEAVVGPCPTVEDIVVKASPLVETLDLDALLITMAANGMMLLERSGEYHHIPSYAHEVFDNTGAGDTVVATFAAYHAAGANYQTAMEIANQAASVVVQKSGTATLNHGELVEHLKRHQATRVDQGFVTLDTLLPQLKKARAAHKKVIFTNGVFDLLHAGHLEYLHQAKALGDYLIVAVNDDASTQRLKGPTRPIHDLQQRMTLLAALRCVDWVISFGEDTPAELIEATEPDMLVKGGDYRAEQLPGASSVLARGGQVRVLPFKRDNSSTRLIDQIIKRQQLEENH